MSEQEKQLSLPTETDANVGGAKVLVTKLVLSAAAASVAETATFPLDLFKTRLQLQGEVALSKSPHGEAVATKQKGLFSIARGIVVDEGFFKLWKGLSPALYRHFSKYYFLFLQNFQILTSLPPHTAYDYHMPV